MNGDDAYSKFTGSISKFINRQWSKVKSSVTNFKSSQNLDQLLEEEYETLLREIDYLTSEKSCYLSFKNDHFHIGKSSEDLTKILRNCSEEVLKNYITQHDKEVKPSVFSNRDDLVNYVTEIIVSRPKCNHKTCACKAIKTSKAVLTDNSVLKKNSKGIQTSQTSQTADVRKQEHVSITAETHIDVLNTEIQTDDWDHDPNCTCGCCPKSGSQVTTRSGTEEWKVQDASTSDKKLTRSKTVLANCVGETADTNTSTCKLCVPENFESLLKNVENSKHFSICTGKQDCACEAYDANEALRRGLILPSSNICVQTKKAKKKEKPKKKKKIEPISSEETSAETTSSDDNAKRKNKNKNGKTNGKESNGKKKSDSTDSESSTSKDKAKNQKKETTGCFGSKKKRKCEEHCQGVVRRQRSMQTINISTSDKSEEAYLYGENDRKAIQTSTNSEMGIQVSVHPSEDVSSTNQKQNKEVSLKEDKDTGRSRELIDIKPKKEFKLKKTGSIKSQSHVDQYSQDYDKEKSAGNQDSQEYMENKNYDGERIRRDQDNKEKTNDVNLCIKCGRQKRDCNSGCRNTIIIPYASGSNRAIPTGEAESLRMLIKMQNKDTSRQFNNIMAELSYQKSEIRRLNDLYQKMIESFYEQQQRSTTSSRSQTKKPSDLLAECGCGSYNTTKRPDAPKSCGCSFSNECKVDNNLNKHSDRSAHSGENINRIPTRRFGPPNTAVAINMCDTCTVEIAGNCTRNSHDSRDVKYVDGDKQRKELFNQRQKTGQNITVRVDSSPCQGDYKTRRIDSISTIYKNDKKMSKPTENKPTIAKRNGHENLIDTKYINTINDENTETGEDEISQILFRDNVKTGSVDADTETDDSEFPKKPKRLYSSRVLIWLKKSWITFKNRTEECRHKHNQRSKPKPMDHVLNFCQSTARRTATGLWKCSSEELIMIYKQSLHMEK